MGNRILVVDDEAVVLGAVTKALSNPEYKIDTVEDVSEALKLAGAADYDVVITDLMMPAMDGLAFMARLREMGIRAEIIMLTGYPTIQTALNAKRLGAFEYVTKPFTRQELISVVVRALRQSGRKVETPASETPTEGRYWLPGHAWVQLEPDRTARIGISRSFAAGAGEILALELPPPDSWLDQGRICLTVRAADGVEHQVYSPLSGRVIGHNPAVVDNPFIAASDPEGAGWLLLMAPEDPEKELPNLAPH
jgi:CheY-like chemotaxis protein/glycine cleavage system H lipoate-binding protein